MSRSWDAVAPQFIERRRISSIGLEAIRRWSTRLTANAAVLDLGCGSGEPIATELARQGHRPSGIDASPAMITEFRRLLPDATAACEGVETSRFFEEQFDAVIAVGLMFLLPPDVQRTVIGKVGQCLKRGGRFLFTAPHQPCDWIDILTQTRSISLGAEAYGACLRDAGLAVVDTFLDEGENHYFDTVKI